MELPDLAKKAAETYVTKGKTVSPPDNLPEKFLNKKSGVFVTIEKEGRLRACIGTCLPTRKNIAEETIGNAIAAASEDWRFGPIRKEELPNLSYTVSVLAKPEPIKDLAELDPEKYGIIVRDAASGRKAGLLLPGLKGIDEAKQQISVACRKGGIDPAREKIIIYKFTVEKYE